MGGFKLSTNMPKIVCFFVQTVEKNSDPRYTILVLKLVNQGVKIGQKEEKTTVLHYQRGICIEATH